MSIASEISRISQNVADSLGAVAAKGVTVPAGSTSDDLPELIAQITSCGAVTVVDEPDGNGGTIRHIDAVDISDTTATAADVAQGKYFYASDGTKTAGASRGNLDLFTWTRPFTWPNIDSLDMSDFEGFYLTYDLSIFPDDNPYICLCCETSDGGAFVIERGHISNGEFVTDDSYESNHRTKFVMPLDSDDGTVQLWRVTAKTGSIQRGVLSAHQLQTGVVYPVGYQPCVEVYMKATGMSKTIVAPEQVYESYDRVSIVGLFTQHIRITGTYNSLPYNFMQNAFKNAYELQLIDFEDASLPTIESMNQCMSNTRKLKTVDFSGCSDINDAAWQLAFYMTGAKRIDMSTLSVSSWTRSFENCNALIDFIPPSVINASIAVNECFQLSHASIIRIINALATTETTLTLTLGRAGLAKLTAEEIAVATEKGWTVA